MVERAFCMECGAEVPVDDAGRCPRGHEVTVRSASGRPEPEAAPRVEPVGQGAGPEPAEELDLSSLEAAVADLALPVEEGDVDDALAAFDDAGAALQPAQPVAEAPPPPRAPAAQVPPSPREPAGETPAPDVLPEGGHLAALEAAAEQGIADLRAARVAPQLPAADALEGIPDEVVDEADVVASSATDVAATATPEPATEPEAEDRGAGRDDVAAEEEPTELNLSYFTARPAPGRGRRRRG